MIPAKHPQNPPARLQTVTAAAVELHPGVATVETPRSALPAGLPEIIHRLNQPLTALRGALELGLMTEGTLVDYRSALEESLHQADALIGMLGRLSEMVEAEDSAEPPEPVPLVQLVRTACDEMLPLADSRRITLSLKAQGDFTVDARGRWLRQAIYKVIHHAVERSPERGAVLVSLVGSQGAACLRISDDGPAPRPGELDHLLQGRSLGQLFSEAVKHGTLEWAIAKRIFEIQGGAVRAETKSGGGCCFSACLPLTLPSPH